MESKTRRKSIAALCCITLVVPLVLSLALVAVPKGSTGKAWPFDAAQQPASISFGALATATPTVLVDPNRVSGNYGWDPGFDVGDKFQVHVNISDTTDLYTWNVKLMWNATLLNCTGIVAYGDFLAQTASPYGTSRITNITRASNETGQLVVAETVLGSYSGVNGSGRLITVEFLILTHGSTNLNITLAGNMPTKLLNSTGDSVAFATTDGFFSNVAPTGDVNGDGVIDIFDLSIVGLAYGSFEGDPLYDPDADLNNDGVVDARDLAMVTFNWGRTAL